MPITSRAQAVDFNGLRQAPAAAERRLPQLVRQDDHLRRVGGGVPGGPGWLVTLVSPVANSRPCAGVTLSAVIRSSVTAAERTRTRPIAGHQVDLTGRERADLGERLIQLAELEELRRRHPELVEALAGNRLVRNISCSGFG